MPLMSPLFIHLLRPYALLEKAPVPRRLGVLRRSTFDCAEARLPLLERTPHRKRSRRIDLSRLKSSSTRRSSPDGRSDQADGVAGPGRKSHLPQIRASIPSTADPRLNLPAPTVPT